MFAELILDAVRPPVLADGEEERHEHVPQQYLRDAVLPVAPVGDVYPLRDDAETAGLGEASDQLYVVELEGGIETPALPEDLSAHRDAVPRAGG